MGKGLKTALKSQQSRLKAKEKAEQAAQAAELRRKKDPAVSKNAKTKGKVVPNQIPTIPFLPHDNILLIGEGNFSFARALVTHPPPVLENLPPNNITATAYDSEEECFEKYPDAIGIVKDLKERGVEVLFGVDGTRLEKTQALKGKTWDRIVWNFPHAGLVLPIYQPRSQSLPQYLGKGITDQDRNILSNQLLILDFFRSAAKVLKTGPVPAFNKSKKRADDDEDEDDAIEHNPPTPSQSQPSAARGTILITLRNAAPYTLWDIPRLAKKPPPPTSGVKTLNPSYIQLRSFMFYRDIWTGYEHRMTKGERAHGMGKTGEGGEDRTWEFCLRD